MSEMSNLKNTSYLYGSNAVFIEELYKKYTENPESVSAEWQKYFEDLNDNIDDVAKSVLGAAWKPNGNRIIGVVEKETAKKISKDAKGKVANDVPVAKPEDLFNSLKAANLINAYRTYGHTDVELDPLGIASRGDHPELSYKFHGFEDEDLDKIIYMGGTLGVEKAPLRDLVAVLKATYSSRIATEYMHIEEAGEREWFQRKLEATAGTVSISKEEKLKALQDLIEAESFESYLHTKFPGMKRFSVEGLENTISAMEVIIQNSASNGVKEFVIGMAHRGRLNTLTKVMGKPYHAMLSEFKGGFAFPEELGIPGDVKYHLGASSDKEINGVNVHMSLTPNPSHLEVVNPVVLGKVRAKQDMLGDEKREKVLGILLHGDAAFAGQGTVMEALSLSQLKGYHTGGTIHIVTNNQIGFTTNPSDSRSTKYATDIAKFIGVPIMHVNGDDAEAVVYASKLAAEYRAQFKKDVVIDIVGYRKYGHNEGDEPMFTQPKMYSVIKQKKNPAEVYGAKLVGENLVSEETFKKMKVDFKEFLDKEFEISKTYKANKADWLEGEWSQYKPAEVNREEVETGFDIEQLRNLGQKTCEVPESFTLNSKIAKQLEAKKQIIESGKNIDWGFCEALAFATLLQEGYKIRMTGQDAKRGTFSHRHAVLFDQKDETDYTPLNNLKPDQQAKLEVHNSNLSEFGVLGFEYGYSFTDPKSLAIWEAQFGDFANGAQVIIDQYISSGEAKWLRMNGLVLLLPHGYEGQGPEHSSARLERFLQLCANDNMQVANCTTPASYFHILRRQMHRDFRKPLVIMSPKSLLRHKYAVSSLEDIQQGTAFRPIIPEVEKLVGNAKVRKVIVCSGKVYYDLLEYRTENKIEDVAIIRMEQIYPFPAVELGRELAKYANAEIIWCQEEHENMGAFFFVEPKIAKVLEVINHPNKRAKYAGRAKSASPAVGYMKLHVKEHEQMMKEAFK